MERNQPNTTRDISGAEIEVLEGLYLLKAQLRPTEAFVTAAAPLELAFAQLGAGGWVFARKTVPAGTTLKIITISRFGDIGLTDDLNATHGYGIRLMPDDPRITNIRHTP